MLIISRIESPKYVWTTLNLKQKEKKKSQKDMLLGGNTQYQERKTIYIQNVCWTAHLQLPEPLRDWKEKILPETYNFSTNI